MVEVCGIIQMRLPLRLRLILYILNLFDACPSNVLKFTDFYVRFSAGIDV